LFCSSKLTWFDLYNNECDDGDGGVSYEWFASKQLYLWHVDMELKMRHDVEAIAVSVLNKQSN